MPTFNLKNPLAWDHILNGEIVQFDNFNGARQISFSINASERVEVFLSFNDQMTDRILIGASDGMFECSYSTAITSFVQIVHKTSETTVYMRGPAGSHTVPAKDEASYTNVEPLGRRNSDLDRVMYEMRLNEKRRDAALGETLGRIRADEAARDLRRAERKAARLAAEAELVIEKPIKKETADVQPATPPIEVPAAD